MPSKNNPAVTPGTNSGINVSYWFWAGAQRTPENKPAPAKDSPVVKDALPADERSVTDLLIQNPGISASGFLNLLKSKGFKVVSDLPQIETKSETSEETKKEADSASSAAGSAVSRETRSETKQKTKKKKEKSNIVDRYCGGLRFRESAASDNGIGITKFEVVLIQEGMGNFGDCFYYTRKALESAVPVFEGKKFFADHPDALEEKTRPERSVRDVCGYFENIRIEEGDEGQALLVGDLVTFPDEPFRWVRALVREAVTYQDKHADKELVGLSINANGDAQETELSKFMEGSDIPPSALPKLKQAMEQGIEMVRVVSAITEAVSCDLVTEAGAGGKVLEMIEKEKLPMGKKKESDKKEADDKEMKKKEGGDEGHDDAAQDKELIKKMLKKHMGVGEEEECDEAEMGHAMQAYEYMKKERKMDDEKACEMAVEAMKCAKHMSAKQAEAKEGDMEKKEAEKKEAVEKKESEAVESKESAEVVKLAGRVAFLEAELTKKKLDEHLDKKLAESKLPMSVTKAFREALGKNYKSEKEIDDKLALFLEGGKRLGEKTGFTISSEKTGTVSESAGFGDCLR